MSERKSTPPKIYREWLGIPEDQVPPDHYTLLGLDLFEPDVAKIEEAARDRIKSVRPRTFKYQEIGTQLLNEIAAARVCLANPERKVEYDALLMRSDDNDAEAKQILLEMAAATPSFDLSADFNLLPPECPPATTFSLPAHPTAVEAAPVAVPRPRRPQPGQETDWGAAVLRLAKQAGPMPFAIGGVVLAILLLGVGLRFLSLGSSRKAVADDKPSTNNSVPSPNKTPESNPTDPMPNGGGIAPAGFSPTNTGPSPIDNGSPAAAKSSVSTPRVVAETETTYVGRLVFIHVSSDGVVIAVRSENAANTPPGFGAVPVTASTGNNLVKHWRGQLLAFVTAPEFAEEIYDYQTIAESVRPTAASGIGPGSGPGRPEQPTSAPEQLGDMVELSGIPLNRAPFAAAVPSAASGPLLELKRVVRTHIADSEAVVGKQRPAFTFPALADESRTETMKVLRHAPSSDFSVVIQGTVSNFPQAYQQISLQGADAFPPAIFRPDHGDEVPRAWINALGQQAIATAKFRGEYHPSGAPILRCSEFSILPAVASGAGLPGAMPTPAVPGGAGRPGGGEPGGIGPGVVGPGSAPPGVGMPGKMKKGSVAPASPPVAPGTNDAAEEAISAGLLDLRSGDPKQVPRIYAIVALSRSGNSYQIVLSDEKVISRHVAQAKSVRRDARIEKRAFDSLSAAQDYIDGESAKKVLTEGLFSGGIPHR